MSGITGIFRRDGQGIVTDEIKQMNDKLAHRGPDGSKIWCEGPVAFGHQMLHTTQESMHEILPFEDEESGLVITADARIDNRKDLALKLGVKDNECVSDSYFILKAFEKWGEKCHEMLIGDFAFAIWDAKKENLFCARDHMGVKPFYYHISNDLFCFATEIKALLTIPEVPIRVNDRKVAFYLVDVTNDKELTFYEDVHRLKAANFLKVGHDDYEKKQYWTLDPDSKIVMDSEDEYYNMFRQIFEEAVKCRLRGSYQRGFDLSGGLDSSSVVCMARKILNPNEIINTYSYVFDDFPRSDERYYINTVVDSGKINPTFVFGDDMAPFDQVDMILWHQDQPIHTPFLSLIGSLYRKMQENNVRILLTGMGGDNVVFAGYNYLSELAVNFKWKKFIQEVFKYSKNRNESILKNLRNDFFFPLIPEYVKRFLNRYIGKSAGIPRHLELFEPNFAQKLKISEYPINIRLNNIKRYNANSYHYYLINTVSSQSVLEMIDHLCAAFYIEPRHPFFDKRLIEYNYSIPLDMKFREGWNRYIQRAGMENVIPKEIQWRPKKAFLDQLLIKNFVLYERDTIRNVIYENQNIMKYLDMDKLKIMYKKYEDGILSNEEDIWFLWAVSQLSIWLDKIK